MKKITPTLEQQSILDCDKNMVITACPGSGKTAVVAEKVRRILPHLPHYKGVAAISYTRKSSAELKIRCGYNGIDTKKSFFGTIDSFCITEIVIPFLGHIFGKSLGDVSVLFLKNLEAKDKSLFDDISISEVTTKHTDSLKDRLKVLYLKGIIPMEFVGILAVFVLDNSLACQRYIKSRYSAIFIDEYQDSGDPQHELFIRFGKMEIFSVAVGDVDQSIFSFSHRDPKYLKSLCAKASGYEHLKLTINHRCHPSIVNYANRLLDETCPLLPINPADDIRVYRRSVAGTQIEILGWINKNLPTVKKKFGIKHNREIGILVRNSNTGNVVAQKIDAPFRLFIDNDLTNEHSLTSDLISLILIYRFDKKITAQSIIDEYLYKRVKASFILSLRNDIANCRRCKIGEFSKYASIAVENILHEKVSQDIIEKLEKILTSKNELKFFEPIQDDEIQIMTLHKSKGLEFKVVFHLDLYDWILPRRVFVEGNFDEVFENEQECLNLHYVGITRAQEACILLSSSQRLNFSNEIKNSRPSQFYAKPGLAGLFK